LRNCKTFSLCFRRLLFSPPTPMTTGPAKLRLLRWNPSCRGCPGPGTFPAGRLPLAIRCWTARCSLTKPEIEKFVLKLILYYFQHTLIVEIRTRVAWLRSTLLLNIECQGTHIYKKTEAAFLGGKGKVRIEIIKNLIRVVRGAWRRAL